MDSITYQTVYSLPSSAFTPSMLLALLGIPLFLAGRSLWRRNTEKEVWHWLQRALLAGGLQLAGLITVGLFLIAQAVSTAYLTIRVARGQAITVSGIVEHFVPGDPGDHVRESWDLIADGVRHHYSYSPSRLTPGYRLTAGHGGRIREGSRVRLLDVDGRIVRLDLEESN